MVRRVYSVVVPFVFVMLIVSAPASAAARPQAYEYLVNGSCDINLDRDGTFVLWGSTTASRPVDRITVVVTLEYWDGTRWIALTSRTLNAYNTWTVSGAWSVIASPGYWYRGFCEHSLYESGVSEYGTATTSPLRY